MSATFHKPKGLKYTEMAIYIDKHLPDIVEDGKNPEIESKIYEYIYHILYALSCKSMFFKNLRDYDEFSIMGASELFVAMRKKAKNAGQIIRGKEIKPIKNALDYIKSVLYPLKVNYQQNNFATILNPEIKQDTSVLGEGLRESVRTTYRTDLYESFYDTVKLIPEIIRKVLNETPYRNDKLLIQKLYISCLLTLINDTVIPEKIINHYKTRLKPTNEYDIFQSLYEKNTSAPILWHLSIDFNDYVILLTRKIKLKTSNILEKDIHEFDLSENLLDSILESAYTLSESDMEE